MLLNYAASLRLSPVQLDPASALFKSFCKALAAPDGSDYTAASGSGDSRTGNHFEAFSVYGTTGLELCLARLLCPVVFSTVARGTINADIKNRIDFRERS